MVDKEYLSKVLEEGNNEESNKEKRLFIDENIMGKTSKDIAEKLINTKPPECGGSIAITGFYYQFLVSIEYLIELYEDKWDYVGIELFDDIIAVKDNKIKFIQVKTSSKNCLKITDPSVNELYRRSYIKDKSEKKFLRNNNWIDKMISKTKFFKKSDNYKTEFELSTSFSILESEKFKEIPPVFLGGENIDGNSIDSNNKLIEELTKDVYYLEEETCIKKLDYEELYGESILNLLSRVRIKEGLSLKFIDEYENKVCSSLQKALFKKENIKIPIYNMKFLVGEIASRCQVKKGSKSCIFDKKEICKLLEKIRQDSIDKSEKSIMKVSNIEYIDDVLNSIYNKYAKSQNGKFINKYITESRNYIINWVQENGGMNVLINRLIDGGINLYKNRNIDLITQKQIVRKFFNIIVILNAANNMISQYLSNKTFLVKRYFEDENILNTFISVCENEIDYGFDKIEEVIVNSDFDEQLHFINKRLKVVFQDYLNSKEEFIDYKEKTINFELKPKVAGIGNEDRLNEVFIVADAIPGHTIIEEATRIIKRNSTGVEDLLLKCINEVMEVVTNECTK